MINEKINFKIYSSTYDEISMPVVWIDNNKNDKRLFFLDSIPRPIAIKILHKDKNIYVQYRKVDDGYKNRRKILSNKNDDTNYEYNNTNQFIEELYQTENKIYISEHYRNILGIRIDNKLDNCEAELKIIYPKNYLDKLWYGFRVSLMHPDIAFKSVLILSLISIISSILGILTSCT